MKEYYMRMPDELHELLREEAHRRRMSMNKIICEALELHLAPVVERIDGEGKKEGRE